MSNLQSPEFFELSDPHPQSSSILRAHPASTGTVQSIDRALAVVTGPETEEPTMAQQEKKTLLRQMRSILNLTLWPNRFNCKTELEDKWDEIQEEMVPSLREFAKEAIASTYDIILHVHYIFHQLDLRTQQSLIEGVEAIEEEEHRQEEARKVMIDFSNEMKRAAEVLKQFGSATTSSLLREKERLRGKREKNISQ
ncbi:hypothetical protein CNBG_6097 [Cryptococcus deuterogattii R265]|uniref:uncharacterized protein n=1 Tax=Cryptococcus deuterogattii (strain R265) TaxID=294750 RepID=UPI001937D07C|nr:hypothetical protein CNBG_6097 [Cryptococcus deuterogattii R265]